MNYPDYILSKVANNMSCDNLLNYNLSRFRDREKNSSFQNDNFWTLTGNKMK